MTEMIVACNPTSSSCDIDELLTGLTVLTAVPVNGTYSRFHGPIEVSDEFSFEYMTVDSEKSNRMRQILGNNIAACDLTQYNAVFLTSRSFKERRTFWTLTYSCTFYHMIVC